MKKKRVISNKTFFSLTTLIGISPIVAFASSAINFNNLSQVAKNIQNYLQKDLNNELQSQNASDIYNNKIDTSSSDDQLNQGKSSVNKSKKDDIDPIYIESVDNSHSVIRTNTLSSLGRIKNIKFWGLTQSNNIPNFYISELSFLNTRKEFVDYEIDTSSYTSSSKGNLVKREDFKKYLTDFDYVGGQFDDENSLKNFYKVSSSNLISQYVKDSYIRKNSKLIDFKSVSNTTEANLSVNFLEPQVLDEINLNWNLDSSSNKGKIFITNDQDDVFVFEGNDMFYKAENMSNNWSVGELPYDLQVDNLHPNLGKNVDYWRTYYGRFGFGKKMTEYKLLQAKSPINLNLDSSFLSNYQSSSNSNSIFMYYNGDLEEDIKSGAVKAKKFGFDFNYGYTFLNENVYTLYSISTVAELDLNKLTKPNTPIGFAEFQKLLSLGDKGFVKRNGVNVPQNLQRPQKQKIEYNLPLTSPFIGFGNPSNGRDTLFLSKRSLNLTDELLEKVSIYYSWYYQNDGFFGTSNNWELQVKKVNFTPGKDAFALPTDASQYGWEGRNVYRIFAVVNDGSDSFKSNVNLSKNLQVLERDYYPQDNKPEHNFVGLDNLVNYPVFNSGLTNKSLSSLGNVSKIGLQFYEWRWNKNGSMDIAELKVVGLDGTPIPYSVILSSKGDKEHNLSDSDLRKYSIALQDGNRNSRDSGSPGATRIGYWERTTYFIDIQLDIPQPIDHIECLVNHRVDGGKSYFNDAYEPVQVDITTEDHIFSKHEAISRNMIHTDNTSFWGWEKQPDFDKRVTVDPVTSSHAVPEDTNIIIGKNFVRWTSQKINQQYGEIHTKNNLTTLGSIAQGNIYIPRGSDANKVRLNEIRIYDENNNLIPWTARGTPGYLVQDKYFVPSDLNILHDGILTTGVSSSTWHMPSGVYEVYSSTSGYAITVPFTFLDKKPHVVSHIEVDFESDETLTNVQTQKARLEVSTDEGYFYAQDLPFTNPDGSSSVTEYESKKYKAIIGTSSEINWEKIPFNNDTASLSFAGLNSFYLHFEAYDSILQEWVSLDEVNLKSISNSVFKVRASRIDGAPMNDGEMYFYFDYDATTLFFQKEEINVLNLNLPSVFSNIQFIGMNGKGQIADESSLKSLADFHTNYRIQIERIDGTIENLYSFPTDLKNGDKVFLIVTPQSGFTFFDPMNPSQEIKQLRNLVRVVNNLEQEKIFNIDKNDYDKSKVTFEGQNGHGHLTQSSIDYLKSLEDKYHKISIVTVRNNVKSYYDTNKLPNNLLSNDKLEIFLLPTAYSNFTIMGSSQLTSEALIMNFDSISNLGNANIISNVDLSVLKEIYVLDSSNNFYVLDNSNIDFLNILHRNDIEFNIEVTDMLTSRKENFTSFPQRISRNSVVKITITPKSGNVFAMNGQWQNVEQFQQLTLNFIEKETENHGGLIQVIDKSKISLPDTLPYYKSGIFSGDIFSILNEFSNNFDIYLYKYSASDDENVDDENALILSVTKRYGLNSNLNGVRLKSGDKLKLVLKVNNFTTFLSSQDRSPISKVYSVDGIGDVFNFIPVIEENLYGYNGLQLNIDQNNQQSVSIIKNIQDFNLADIGVRLIYLPDGYIWSSVRDFDNLSQYDPKNPNVPSYIYLDSNFKADHYNFKNGSKILVQVSTKNNKFFSNYSSVFYRMIEINNLPILKPIPNLPKQKYNTSTKQWENSNYLFLKNQNIISFGSFLNFDDLMYQNADKLTNNNTVMIRHYQISKSNYHIDPSNFDSSQEFIDQAYDQVKRNEQSIPFHDYSLEEFLKTGWSTINLALGDMIVVEITKDKSHWWGDDLHVTQPLSTLITPFVVPDVESVSTTISPPFDSDVIVSFSGLSSSKLAQVKVDMSKTNFWSHNMGNSRDKSLYYLDVTNADGKNRRRIELKIDSTDQFLISSSSEDINNGDIVTFCVQLPPSANFSDGSGVDSNSHNLLWKKQSVVVSQLKESFWKLFGKNESQIIPDISGTSGYDATIRNFFENTFLNSSLGKIEVWRSKTPNVEMIDSNKIDKDTIISNGDYIKVKITPDHTKSIIDPKNINLSLAELDVHDVFVKEILINDISNAVSDFVDPNSHNPWFEPGTITKKLFDFMENVGVKNPGDQYSPGQQILLFQHISRVYRNNFESKTYYKLPIVDEFISKLTEFDNLNHVDTILIATANDHGDELDVLNSSTGEFEVSSDVKSFRFGIIISPKEGYNFLSKDSNNKLVTYSSRNIQINSEHRNLQVQVLAATIFDGVTLDSERSFNDLSNLRLSLGSGNANFTDFVNYLKSTYKDINNQMHYCADAYRYGIVITDTNTGSIIKRIPITFLPNVEDLENAADGNFIITPDGVIKMRIGDTKVTNSSVKIGFEISSTSENAFHDGFSKPFVKFVDGQIFGQVLETFVIENVDFKTSHYVDSSSIINLLSSSTYFFEEGSYFGNINLLFDKITNINNLINSPNFKYKLEIGSSNRANIASEWSSEIFFENNIPKLRKSIPLDLIKKGDYVKIVAYPADSSSSFKTSTNDEAEYLILLSKSINSFNIPTVVQINGGWNNFFNLLNIQGTIGEAITYSKNIFSSLNGVTCVYTIIDEKNVETNYSNISDFLNNLRNGLSVKMAVQPKRGYAIFDSQNKLIKFDGNSTISYITSIYKISGLKQLVNVINNFSQEIHVSRDGNGKIVTNVNFENIFTTSYAIAQKVVTITLSITDSNGAIKLSKASNNFTEISDALRQASIGVGDTIDISFALDSNSEYIFSSWTADTTTGRKRAHDALKLTNENVPKIVINVEDILSLDYSLEGNLHQKINGLSKVVLPSTIQELNAKHLDVIISVDGVDYKNQFPVVKNGQLVVVKYVVTDATNYVISLDKSDSYTSSYSKTFTVTNLLEPLKIEDFNIPTDFSHSYSPEFEGLANLDSSWFKIDGAKILYGLSYDGGHTFRDSYEIPSRLTNGVIIRQIIKADADYVLLNNNGEYSNSYALPNIKVEGLKKIVSIDSLKISEKHFFISDEDKLWIDGYDMKKIAGFKYIVSYEDGSTKTFTSLQEDGTVLTLDSFKNAKSVEIQAKLVTGTQFLETTNIWAALDTLNISTENNVINIKNYFTKDSLIRNSGSEETFTFDVDHKIVGNIDIPFEYKVGTRSSVWTTSIFDDLKRGEKISVRPFIQKNETMIITKNSLDFDFLIPKNISQIKIGIGKNDFNLFGSLNSFKAQIDQNYFRAHKALLEKLNFQVALYNEKYEIIRVIDGLGSFMDATGVSKASIIITPKEGYEFDDGFPDKRISIDLSQLSYEDTNIRDLILYSSIGIGTLATGVVVGIIIRKISRKYGIKK